MKLTDAEINHLIHIARENYLLKKGPALTWNGDNGILPHELLPLFRLLVDELKEEGRIMSLGELEPDQEWAPPAPSGEEFRKRIIEIEAEAKARAAINQLSVSENKQWN